MKPAVLMLALSLAVVVAVLTALPSASARAFPLAFDGGHYYDYGHDSTCTHLDNEESPASWLLGEPNLWSNECCWADGHPFFFQMIYQSSPTYTVSNYTVWYPSLDCGPLFPETYKLTIDVAATGPSIICQRATLHVSNSTWNDTDYLYVTLSESPDIPKSSSSSTGVGSTGSGEAGADDGDSKRTLMVVIIAVVTVLLTIVAVIAGIYLYRRHRARSLPLSEAAGGQYAEPLYGGESQYQQL